MESKNYRFFVLNGMLTGEKEDDIFRDVYGGFLLGKAQFIKEKLKELKTQAESDKISYSKELHLGIEPGVIIEEVARRFKKNPQDLIDSKKDLDRKAGSDIFDKASHGINKWGDRQDIQDESAGSEQGRHKDREVGEGEREDKESGKQANFYFQGLTPLLSPSIYQLPDAVNKLCSSHPISSRPCRAYTTGCSRPFG